MEGEPRYRRLAAAVILAALETIERGARPGASKRDVQAALGALAWFQRDYRGYPFTYLNLADLLEIAPERGRRRVQRMLDEAIVEGQG